MIPRWIVLCALLSVNWLDAQPRPQPADELYAAGDFQAAQAAYEALAEAWRSGNNRDSVDHYTMRAAKCALQLGDFDQTISRTRNLLGQRPQPTAGIAAEAAVQVAQAHLVLGQLDSADHYVQRSIHWQTARNHPDTTILAKAYDLKAVVALNRSEQQVAREAIEQAYALRVAIYDSLDLELGYGANTKYLVMDGIGDPVGATQAARQAWRILSANLPAGHPHLAVIANNLSLSYADQGNPYQARQFMEQAIQTNMAGERWELLLENYYNLAYLQVQIQDWQGAELSNLRALQIADTLLAVPHERHANILDGLGAVYWGSGRTREADSMFRLVLRERNQLFSPPHPDLAQSHYNLGLVAMDQQAYPQAKQQFTQAKAMWATLQGEKSGKWADAHYELAELDWLAGKPEAALASWQQTLGIYRETRGARHSHLLENYLRLGQAYRDLHEPQTGHSYLQEAWEIVFPTDGDSLPIYVPEILDLAILDLELASEAVPAGTGLTRSHLESVMAWLPDYLALFPPGSESNDLLAKVQQFYRLSAHRAYLQLQKKNVPQRQAWQHILLRCLQESRGSSIRMAIRRREAMEMAGIPPALRRHGEQLEEQMRYLFSLETESTDEDVLAQRAAAADAWKAYQAQLRADYPLYYEARYASTPLQLHEWQRSLGEDRAVVYLSLDSAFLVLQVDANHFQSQLLPVPPTWTDSLLRYEHLLRRRDLSADFSRLSHLLYQWLWAPLGQDLPTGIRIFPDVALYRLNWETLLSKVPDPELPVHRWPFLLRRHRMVYGHQLQPETRQQAQRATTPWLGLAPGFDRELKAQYQAHLPPGAETDSLFMTWLPTPWSTELVQSLGKSWSGRSLTGTNATETAFWESASTAAVLHFGTHARLMDQQPLQSFFALTPDPEAGNDGYLYLYELYRQPLSAQLAVLTACETGLGPYRPGEGLLSLAHAFRYAGCPNVVHSLWPIDDEQSQALNQLFYEALAEGKNPAAALRAAKLQFLVEAEPGYQAPYFWAGLILTGANQPLQRHGWDWRWLLGIGTVLIAVIWLWQKKKTTEALLRG